ncbi:hypothetical protein [Geomonas anaerohicana]|uniref:Transposase n=1 Tax=Geomonas anaerohicana TaxID=2798583 RepID=A0ABS0YEQ5_9BACT|nr:hypothetical protein [Geomonas anaerohicana]MBJ6750791.1 hypothetical protein [Geomonas anaerohicana]
MRSRYKAGDGSSTYFVTSTIVEWIPLFTSARYNPVRRGLVSSPEHWVYSSAANYFQGAGIIDVDPMS